MSGQQEYFYSSRKFCGALLLELLYLLLVSHGDITLNITSANRLMLQTLLDFIFFLRRNLHVTGLIYDSSWHSSWMEISNAPTTGCFVSPNIPAPLNKANLALPACLAMKAAVLVTFNIHQIEAEETTNLTFCCSKGGKKKKVSTSEI